MGFNLYWPAGTTNWKDMRVFVAVQKDILSQIIVEHQINLVSHPYCMVLDIKKVHTRSKRCIRITRIVNLYDNKVGEGQLWEGPSRIARRAIQDIPWQLVI